MNVSPAVQFVEIARKHSARIEESDGMLKIWRYCHICMIRTWHISEMLNTEWESITCQSCGTCQEYKIR